MFQQCDPKHAQSLAFGEEAAAKSIAWILGRATGPIGFVGLGSNMAPCVSFQCQYSTQKSQIRLNRL